MPEWSPDTRRALRAYVLAVAVAEPLQRALARTYGVALTDLHALRLLRDMGAVPVGRLGAALQLRPSSTTNLVDRLEGAGLVERYADVSDRRVTLLRLTDRASDTLSDRTLLEQSGLVARIERLSTEERLLLASLLERIVVDSEEADTDAPLASDAPGRPGAGPDEKRGESGDEGDPVTTAGETAAER